MKPRLVRITDCIMDTDVYPRQKLDWITAYDYAQAMKAGAVFPPIILGKLNSKLYVVDGWHRIAATKHLKVEYIRAEIKSYADRKSLFIDAVKFNTAHGQRLSMWDKTKIVDLLKKYGVTREEISTIVKIPLVNIKLFEVRTITGPNGEPIYLKGITSRMSDTMNVVPTDVNQDLLTASSVKTMVKQLIGVFQAKPEIADKELLDLIKELIALIEPLAVA